MVASQRLVLPATVRPLRYALTLEPDLNTDTFQGHETVEIEVVEPTASITLNAIELQVQSASIVSAGAPDVEASNIDYDSAAETVTLTFLTTVPAGRAQLTLAFTGILNDRLHGFYRSTYQGLDGVTRKLAATQFEATDARRAFPCWDEPSLKATFQTTLVIPEGLTAVSNTLIDSLEPTGAGKLQVRFKETPRMSTYLLIFVVGELDHVEGRSSDGTTIRVWTTPGNAEQGRFALEFSSRLLPYYNEYFGIPYPLEKLDHLAIPDFAAGAMENWGAITYRETALLFDPENSAPGTRQRIAEVVAHEMAHMWFGDLVTMEWWNDLWLNESFASWLEVKGVDHLFPEWNMWTQFIYQDVNSGMGLDGLENSHPIEVEVADPAQISELFDAISYSKGASLIRMLEQFIGPEQFRRGLNRYMQDHMYGNATTDDLWRAMADASGRDVAAIMNSWIRQPGYPVLRADIRRQDGNIQVELHQQRFLYNGLNQDQALWRVPVSLLAQGAGQSETLVLEERQATTSLPEGQSVGDGAWVKINLHQTGFYRVQYSQQEWARLIPAIRSQELPAGDRLGLQSDVYALCQAGLVPATQLLELTQAYARETEYPVWAEVCTNLRRIGFLISGEPYLPRFEAMGRELLSDIVQDVGWEPEGGEGHLRALLRSTVLGALGAFGDDATLAQASARFQRYLQEPGSLSPDLRSVVYGLAARAGGASTYDALRRLGQDTPLQEEKVRLQMSLAQFRDPALLQKTLELSLSPKVRHQETVALVGAVSANPHGGTQAAWDYVKENWAEFYRRYGSGGFAIMRLVGITGNFSTTEAKADVEDFFQKHPTPSASRTIQQCLERIALNARWLEQNRDGLARWFRE